MKKYLKIFPVFIAVMLFLTAVVTGQSVQSFAKKALSHNQINGNEQFISKNSGMHVTNYGSPTFDNPNYYYAAIKTAPSSVWYRQAGLSPDGTKIVAQKSYTDGLISRVEVVLMNADGSGETIISPINSGVGDIQQNGNPFWSDDGLAIGYVESHVANPNKVVKYVLASSLRSYIYEPVAPNDVNNADFLGSSTTSIVFWSVDGGGFADLFTWNGVTLTNITNTPADKEYEPVSNAAGDKIVYWSGETVGEPINTTHTLTYSTGSWHKDVGFTPIVDSYWPFWSTRADDYIGVTVMSTKDVNIYNNTGTLVSDLTGPGYSGGAGQWNFFGIGFEGPNGEILMSSNAGRIDPGRDIVFATPRTKLYVNVSTGNDLFPGTERAPFATVGKSVTEAIAGGTVNFNSGTYPHIIINKSLTLNGHGAIITNASPAITVTADNVTIDGFAFSYGAADYAIQINANYTNINIHNCNFNTPNAVQNLGTGSVNATNNYWGFGGNINGPTIVSNPGGTGGVINVGPGTVTYNPWVGKITSPANTYVGTPINGFTISWDWLSFFGPNFVFQLDHNGVAGSDINTAVTTNSYTISSALLYNTTYHWYVRSTADPLNVWIGPFNFTTISAAPTLVSPSNGALGIDASVDVNFSWNSAAGANLYQIQVDNDAGFGSPEVQTTTVSTSITDGGVLLPGVVYNWRVRSSNNGGVSWGSWSAAWTFTTNYLVSPANLSVGVSIIPLFDWLDVTSAASYTLEISTDNTFGTVNFTYSGLVVSNYQVLLAGALTNGVTYYWRVTSNNAVVSGTWAFIVVQPSVPYLTNPTNGSTLFGNTIYFTWYSLRTSASNFVLQVDDANDFLTPIQTFSGLTSSYYSWVYTGLTPGSTYYWRITAKTSGGVIVNYSSTWTFIVPGMPDVFPSYPTGGVTVYTTLPSLYWYTGTFYNGQFQIRYGTTSGALGAPIATSNMYYTLSGLTAGSTYYWQVRSYNGVQFGNWSSEQSFVVYSTTAAVPVVPYLSWPIGGATVYTNPPSFYWYLGTYSTGLEFYFEYDDDSGFGSPNGNSGWISTMYYTLPTSLASGTWYWHVKSRLAAPPNTASAWSTTESFVILPGSSSVSTPTPTSPVGGITVYVLNPTLTYYAYSALALQYQINYSAWPGTDISGVLNLSNTTSAWTSSTSYILAGLTPGVTYYWQVRARLSATPATMSSWSSVATFTTAAGASAVVPLVGSPNYNQSIDKNTAVLSWIIPTQSSSPLTYTVQYSNKPDMSNAVTVNNVSKPEYQLKGLAQNKTYYWRVSSNNTNGSSNYSSIGSFNTGGVTDVPNEQQVLPAAFELSQNYPNPFNPATKITYALPQNSFVSIKVYDMLGREVKSLINNEMLAGNHSVDWNGENNSGFKVSSGTYVYRITAGNFVAVKKMILIK